VVVFVKGGEIGPIRLFTGLGRAEVRGKKGGATLLELLLQACMVTGGTGSSLRIRFGQLKMISCFLGLGSLKDAY
jgi:hypothetical protein